MNWKTTCLAALVLALAGICPTWGQNSAPPQDGTIAPSPAGNLTNQPAPVEGTVFPSSLPRLSSWIMGTRPDCCGPMGADGPIGGELYARWGINIPTNAGYLGKTNRTGWEIQGGGRGLFFNAPADAAWTVDLSISNVAHQGKHPDNPAVLHNVVVLGPPDFSGQRHPVTIPELPVTVSNLNRTYANLALGREWYLLGNGHSFGSDLCSPGAINWRVGCDVGGRWGSAKLGVHELTHFTDTITGLFLSLHTDLEIPCGCSCIFVVGGRVEWDYTWTDILPGIDCDMQNVNLLMTLGIRF